MSVRATTVRRIEEAHRFSAFYGGYSANHLPMALVALDAMGADDDAIDGFRATYQPRLEPMGPASFEIGAGDEPRHLGSPAAFPAWVAYFERAIALRGVQAVLVEWIDGLLAGVGSAAFHGAIRTAYALESGSDREMAHALGYWCSAFEPLPATPAPAGDLTPADVLRRVAADPKRAGKRLPGRSIARRTLSAVSLPEFARLVSSVDPTQLELEPLARALIRCYCASGDFTILHGVTGCHAFRLLSKCARDRRSAVEYLWRAVLATYIGCGSPPLDGFALQGSDSLDWPGIHARAIQCEDEHDVKLAYSCWREWQRTGEDLYRRAASARVCNAAKEAMAC